MTEEIREEEKNLRPGNIQDVFLNNARKNRSPIIVYLISGFQMRGIVKSFDNYVILLESEGKQSMIYKHAVSTISPL
ncbi:MAG: RNA chaperone Hfq [Clostridia bacterium]|nr:RNA chaperone Hfq [Clostridia bacterium]